MNRPPRRPRPPNRRKCEACGISKKSKDVFLARFPLDPDRCRTWVKVVGNEDLAYLPIEKLNELKFVCGSHFPPKCFTKTGTRLRRTAVPSLKLLYPPLSDEIMSNFPMKIYSENIGFTTTEGTSEGNIVDNVLLQNLQNPRETTSETEIKKAGDHTLTKAPGHVEPASVGTKTPTAASATTQPPKPSISIFEVKKTLPELTLDPALKDILGSLQTTSKIADPSSIQIKADKALVSTISKVDEVTGNADVITVEDDDYIGDITEAEETPFSWQQDVAVVPCDDIDIDCGTNVDEHLFPASAKTCDVTKVTSADEDEAAQSKHEGFKCNICFSEIVGFRYACVQCADWDLCGACEARRAHPHHYVLRVPEGRPPGEVRARLQTLRRALHDAIVTVAAPGDDVEIKKEEDDPMDVESLETSVPARSEPNLTGDITPLRAVRTSGSHGTKTEPSDDDDDDSYKPCSGSSDDESQTSEPASFPGTDPPQQEPATTAPLAKIQVAVVTCPTEKSQCFSLEVEKVDPESCLPPPTKTRVIDIRDLPQSVRERLRVQVVSAARVQSERSVGRVVLYPARRAVRAPHPPHPHPHPPAPHPEHPARDHLQQALHQQASVRLQRLTSPEINAALRNS